MTANNPLDKDAIRAKYREERDKRLRPDGNEQYVEVVGRFARFVDDPYVEARLERDAAIDDGHDGPRPSGGVGGTRTGVKCLHAHVAHHLATGADEIGRWTLDRIAEVESDGDPARGSPTG